MNTPDARILAGQLVEEQLTWTLDELGGACRVGRERIVELIEHGVIETVSEDPGRVSGDALRRARLALRLQRDLDINAAGAALVLELLERIELLEARLGAGLKSSR